MIKSTKKSHRHSYGANDVCIVCGYPNPLTHPPMPPVPEKKTFFGAWEKIIKGQSDEMREKHTKKSDGEKAKKLLSPVHVEMVEQLCVNYKAMEVDKPYEVVFGGERLTVILTVNGKLVVLGEEGDAEE